MAYYTHFVVIASVIHACAVDNATRTLFLEVENDLEKGKILQKIVKDSLGY